MHKAAQAYFKTQVTTTSQDNLLLLLYDGCIRFLNQAKEKIEQRDMAGKGILLSKALDVIGELQCSLNRDKGGELAENLHNLYFLCQTKLLQANVRLDTDLIDEVIKVLTGLRMAYAQIAAPGAGQTSVQPAADEEPSAVQKSAPPAPAADDSAPLRQAPPAPPAPAEEQAAAQKRRSPRLQRRQ